MSRKNKEQRTYPTEIPSREEILEALVEAGVPMADAELQRALGINEEQQEGFGRRVAAMEREGEVMRNRRGAILIADKAGLIKGKVIGHPDGFGFLQPEDGSDDLFLGPKQMHKAFHGDVVLARVTGIDRRGRREGSIVEVLERANRRVVGRLFVEHGVMFVIAENKRINQDILVAPDGSMGAKSGQVVMVEILEQPTKNAEPIGRVIEVLGNYADPGMEIEIALRKHDLPHVFSGEVEKAAGRFPKEVLAKDLKGRKDLRHLAFVTIDGETARDFDDAVYCERQAKGFRLWVAIADVSHYVKPRDALDLEAYERGNSVYFPRRVIPMLPEALSNELCSLKPNVDRLVMVCEMEISNHGSIQKYAFYPAVIHSAARLTYTQVAAVIEGKEVVPLTPSPALPQGGGRTSSAPLSLGRGAGGEGPPFSLPLGGGLGRGSLEDHIASLYAVFKSLLGARGKRGAIDFDSVESQMIFDDKGKIERIVRVQRNDAHRLIEECMLAANVCASDFLQENGQGTLYRIHEGPTPEKLEALRSMLKDFGLTLGGGDEPQAKDYAQLISRIKGKPYADMLQTVMLRSLRQAVYSPENVGHFGLAYEAYTHFTSPIRRYPDLLVHRAIKAVLKKSEYDPGDWHALGNHCSETERRADEATRDVETWLKCWFMQDHVGTEFDGTISGVTNFGLFVTLDELFVDGLVHISDLGADYYQFEAGKHLLRGERSGVRYQLGGRVRVKVVRVDIESAKIDFVLVQAEDKAGATGRREATPKPRDIDKKMAKLNRYK